AASGRVPPSMDRRLSRQRLARAIAHSRFAELRRQERVSGFREKPPRMDSFFRSGRVGSWRTALSSTQVKRLVEQHGEAMRRLGYLSADGEVVDVVEPFNASKECAW